MRDARSLNRVVDNGEIQKCSHTYAINDNAHNRSIVSRLSVSVHHAICTETHRIRPGEGIAGYCDNIARLGTSPRNIDDGRSGLREGSRSRSRDFPLVEPRTTRIDRDVGRQIAIGHRAIRRILMRLTWTRAIRKKW